MGITDLLDEAQLKSGKQKDEFYSTKSPLRPSAAGYCTRRLCYATGEHRGYWNYDKPTRKPNITRLLDLGHYIEEHSIENFKLIPNIEILYTQQVLDFFHITRISEADEKSEHEWISGANDLVLYHPEWKGLGDVKSKKDNWSAFYKSSWVEEMETFRCMESVTPISATALYLEDPKAFIEEVGDNFITDNIYQLNLYAFSDFFLKRDLDFCFIYRYNKNDSTHMELRWSPDKALYDEVLEKFQTASICADKKKPEDAPRDWWLGSMRCAFCPYQSDCWGGEDALRKYFNTLPRKKYPRAVAEFSKLDNLFREIEELDRSQKKRAVLECEAIKVMTQHELKRIQLPNGHVYELKYLKSPRPRLEIRRGKLI